MIDQLEIAESVESFHAWLRKRAPLYAKYLTIPNPKRNPLEHTAWAHNRSSSAMVRHGPDVRIKGHDFKNCVICQAWLAYENGKVLLFQQRKNGGIEYLAKRNGD